MYTFPWVDAFYNCTLSFANLDVISPTTLGFIRDICNIMDMWWFNFALVILLIYTIRKYFVLKYSKTCEVPGTLLSIQPAYKEVKTIEDPDHSLLGVFWGGLFLGVWGAIMGFVAGRGKNIVVTERVVSGEIVTIQVESDIVVNFTFSSLIQPYIGNLTAGETINLEKRTWHSGKIEYILFGEKGIVT